MAKALIHFFTKTLIVNGVILEVLVIINDY